MGNQRRRQTKRERKIEAKQRRLEEIRRRQRRARMRKVGTLVTVLVVLAVIAGAVALSGRAERQAIGKINDVASGAGCGKVDSPPIENVEHINPPQTGRYETVPPTSGVHYNAPGQGPVNTGIHTAPIPNEGQVHNLEHGHVGIQYEQGLDPAVLAKLEAFTRSRPTAVFLAPYDLPGSDKVVFTAWGRILRCTSPNASIDKVAEAFVKEFNNKAPERDRPGTPTPQTEAATTPSPTATTSPKGTSSPKPTPTR